MGYCPVTLIEENRVAKGDQLLLLQYKEKKYVFENEAKLQKFAAWPAKYYKAELPVKMPPTQDPVSLFQL